MGRRRSMEGGLGGKGREVRRVWVYAKPSVDQIKLSQLERSLRASSLEVAVHPSYPTSSMRRMPAREAAEWADVALVVGGDGTLLRVYHETRGALPLLGVNVGSVGYLMEVSIARVGEALELLSTGEYEIEERIVGLASTGQSSYEFVNEAVVSSPEHSRLIRASVYVDNALFLQGRLDGLIVATPTGSTAYALSAGGPVLDTTLHAFSIVPIAPFTALAKPLVVSSRRRVEVATERCRLTIDGLRSLELEACTVRFTEAPSRLRLVRLPIGEDHWTKLVRRLTDTPPMDTA